MIYEYEYILNGETAVVERDFPMGEQPNSILIPWDVSEMPYMLPPGMSYWRVAFLRVTGGAGFLKSKAAAWRTE